MAITSSFPIVGGFSVTTAFTTLYTVVSPYNRINITAAVFNNYSSSNVTLSIRVNQEGTGSSLTEIVTDFEVRAGESFIVSEIIGQAVSLGGTIEAKASANSSLNAAITAALIT